MNVRWWIEPHCGWSDELLFCWINFFGVDGGADTDPGLVLIKLNDLITMKRLQQMVSHLVWGAHWTWDSMFCYHAVMYFECLLIMKCYFHNLETICWLKFRFTCIIGIWKICYQFYSFFLQALCSHNGTSNIKMYYIDKNNQETCWK